MFGPWMALWAWLKGIFPNQKSFSKPHFNFITIHYIYLISLSLIGSVMLYPAGGMAYIDALLFASGSCTQSGLNPLDINTLNTYQQVVIFFLACICNPIFINTFVVFVRLYWFEKRFQHVVHEAMTFRHTRTKSRSKSQAKGEQDAGREEAGVGAREIRVLRASDGHAQGRKIDEQVDGFRKVFDEEEEKGESSNGGSSSGQDNLVGSADDIPFGKHENASATEIHSPSTFHRDIVFADELNPRERPSHFRSLSGLERIPEQRSKEQNIAFVENQRNPRDKGTLRIPGPRDFDRGDLPQHLNDEEAALDKQISNDQPHGVRRSLSRPPEELNADDHPIKQNITINEPDHPRRPGTGISSLNFNKRSATTGEESTVMTLRQRARSRTFGSFMSKTEEERDPMPYLSWTPTIGRNSAFVDLTEEQREELGGIEYRALKLLALILVVYYVGFHLLGMICLLPWVVREKKYSGIINADGQNPVWWGFFTPASMFNDLGFTLTPDSMVSFGQAVFPMLLGTFLIIIGNTGFPCMLRFVIWIVQKCVPMGSAVWEELRFLLDHPRRCFTLLFPSSANWWLFWILVLLNVIDLVFFIILDLNDPTVTSLPGGYRFLDGLFQAASTRTAGFSVVNLADLHPAIQVSYLIMMYISVFPIAISMRQTNVYEEKSLGVWSQADEEDDQPNSYLSAHLRRQLSFDLWFVFLGFFLIAIIEGGRLENTDDYAFTLFSVLFEIVSAYGTVGLSLGYPGVNTSFCGQFRALSKLIIVAMQIRGRHRGLPYALDRAILLPSESLHKKEDQDAMRRARRGSHASEAPDREGLYTNGPTPSGRRGSTYSAHDGASVSGGRERPHGLSRLLSQALSASPTIQREKHA
ncbi:high affinity potassium transport protein [Mytilinidion resinicola]|uniref:Potassium transport protein n=1 Tax=Mytilinidion resinicola TaxID=574789 RepID=A0A6A6Z5N0_9PEZI|nr:high affinity potassium transport protein [Mytilinidion resinicola]KAF2816340.1 high affinity potassium transport protein [Mytilinidion resinicola]